MKKRTLILKSDANSFERFYIKKMNYEDVDTVPMYRRLIYKHPLLFRIHMHSPLDIFSTKSFWYGEWKNKLDVYDTIIVFDSLECMSILDDIHRRNPNIRIIMWYWNIIKKKWRIPKKKDYIEYWSFDDNDCEKYNMRKNNQFLVTSPIRLDVPQMDFLFVGVDKGRGNLLSDINLKIKKEGFLTDFFVVKDKRTSEKARKSFCYYEKPISYEQILEKIGNSRCIIDVGQKEQNGLTIRTLEAMFYQKKMLTTNRKISEEEFYDKDNVFIWGKDNIEDLKAFMDAPIKSIPDDILRKYSFKGWLENFAK